MLDMLMDDVWTPKDVGEYLVEAVKWAQKAAGPVGPAGYRGGLPDPALTSDERELEGWLSIAEIEEIDPPKQMRLNYSPAKVSQMERVLAWPMKYMDPAETGAIRVLKVWLRCRITRGQKFDAACKVRGWARATAYRQLDKALAQIALGLTRDGIVKGRH